MYKHSKQQYEIPLWLNDINPDDDCIVTFEIISFGSPEARYNDGTGQPSESGEFKIIKIIALNSDGEIKEIIDHNDIDEKTLDIIADAILDKIEDIKYSEYQNE